jgi:hypothetical protein
LINRPPGGGAIESSMIPPPWGLCSKDGVSSFSGEASRPPPDGRVVDEAAFRSLSERDRADVASDSWPSPLCPTP